jgi:hypothetical protein
MGMGQLWLFTRAEVAAMRDRARRRNYSVEAETFRREHKIHRAWGLEQRYARKMTRLYGSPANAAAVFQRLAAEALSKSAASREAESETSRPAAITREPRAPETAPTGQVTTGQVTTGQVTTGQVTAGQVTAGQVTAGQVTAGQVTAGQVTMRQATAETGGRELVGSDVVKSEQTSPELVNGAAVCSSEPADRNRSGHGSRQSVLVSGEKRDRGTAENPPSNGRRKEHPPRRPDRVSAAYHSDRIRTCQKRIGWHHGTAPSGEKRPRLGGRSRRRCHCSGRHRRGGIPP